ncbi:MAG TPA: dienelactone hydrolase family protein [Anaerolineales bacterium]|nr:dienelactone hydrolase family protein [Anaerolineales bacterium]
MDLQLDVNGTKVNAALSLPPGGSGPGVLLLHAWWGLNPFFKSLCDRIAAQGFVCLAPDLFQGETAKTREEAEDLVNRRDDDDYIGSVVTAAKDHLLAHPVCTSEKIGVVGFSFGAAWVLVLASQALEQIGAGVLFYGIWRADFVSIQAPILGHFSDMDEWEPYDNTVKLIDEMGEIGLDVEFHSYPGQPHWFMESDRPEYDAEAAELAWERTFAFIKKHL